MPWFVTYQHEADGTLSEPRNVILFETHPVVWAATASRQYRETGFYRLLFFCEIPDDVARHPSLSGWAEVKEGFALPARVGRGERGSSVMISGWNAT